MSSVDNERIQRELERGPEAVATALEAWRNATRERKKAEALLFAKLKGEAAIDGKDITATELKYAITANDQINDLSIAEIKSEAEYTRVNEKHMANKKIASMLSAF